MDIISLPASMVLTSAAGASVSAAAAVVSAAAAGAVVAAGVSVLAPQAARLIIRTRTRARESIFFIIIISFSRFQVFRLEN